jgi:hypothetical protein
MRPVLTALSAVLALMLTLPAHARALGEEEQAALMKSVESYLRATGAGNAEKIVATIPPRILNVFAGTTGIEASKMEATLVEQTEALLKTTKIRDFSVTGGPYEATDETLADGTAVTWVVVPIAFTAETGGKKSRNAQPLLALNEGGTWYFSRIDGPQQQQIVALAYPFIAGAKLPEATSAPAE